MVYVTSIIVAAGKGTRMGLKQKKQYLYLNNKPLLIHTLEIMERQMEIKDVILVVPEEDIDFCKSLCRKYNLKKIVMIVAGGKTRGESVYNGLQAVPEYSQLVVVHDGARPFLSKDVLHNAILAGQEYGAAVVAVPVKDTIKEVSQERFVQKTLNRQLLWAVQTPQVFKKKILLKCYEKAFVDNISGTDDASIVEYYNHPVKIILGRYDNIKITTKEDLALAQFILKQKEDV